MSIRVDMKAEVKEAARKGLSPTEVLDVTIAPYVGSDGTELLRVTILVPDQQFDKIDGTHFLSALLNIKARVREIGDDRQTLVGYATPSELADLGNAES